MRKPVIATMAVVSLVLAGCGTRVAPSQTSPTVPLTANDTPANQTPGTEAPANQAPNNQSPNNQTPGNQTPGNQTPANQTPANQTPANQTPANQTPANQTPNSQTPPKPPAAANPVKREIPNPVRGIMISGWYAGSPDLSGPLMTWAKGAGINTLVLDIKAEDGKLSWESDVPLAKEIGANLRKVGDMGKAIQEMHDQGFWVAGRIVVYNDASLYRGRPAWGIPGFPGGAYSFMDPKNENVWQYNIDVAKAAAALGVDEIQFDYIRYPDRLVAGFNKDTGPEFRAGNINQFLKKAVDVLHPLGIKVSADVFGLTTSVAEGDDMQIGQDYKQMAQIVDYISAMAYPSHYAAGTYGIADPNRAPYETVKNSLQRAIDRTPGIPAEKHRPWIQDFTLGGVHYGSPEVMAQVKALNDIGITSWLIWDPNNKYSRGNDYSKTGQ
jgi:hypothetical protein